MNSVALVYIADSLPGVQQWGCQTDLKFICLSSLIQTRRKREVPVSYYQYHVFFCTNLREDGSQCCQKFGAQDVRDYAREHGMSEREALSKGMEEKSVEFVQGGAEIYKKA